MGYGDGDVIRELESENESLKRKIKKLEKEITTKDNLIDTLTRMVRI